MEYKKEFFPNNRLEELNLINNINFTPREIDVMAGLVSARGTSKISSFLSIAPKTVVNHIRNLMQKVGCNSREGIIDFIEKSNKQSLLRAHYSQLLLQASFNKSLKKIAKLFHKYLSCSLIYWEAEVDDLFLKNLKIDLELTGFKVLIELGKSENSSTPLIEESKSEHYSIYIMPKKLRDIENITDSEDHSIIGQVPDNSLFLFTKKEDFKEIPKNFSGVRCIDCTEFTNFYFLFFNILKSLFPDINLDNIIKEFKQQSELIYESPGVKNLQEGVNAEKILLEFPTKMRFLKKQMGYFLIAFIAIMSILSIEFFILQGGRETPTRSDLPSDTTALNRTELIEQMDKTLKGQKGIQTIALVGIGGAGKTTLARQYARQQTRGVIWEINAETNSSLMESFEKLAQALSKTKQDQKLLREIEESKDSLKREAKLISFIKERLKLQKAWFLIYDNVENFMDIQKYFPQDSNTWGGGKIILTTRNHNIQNNRQIGSIILIGELTPNQKINLFMQIMNHGENRRFTSTQRKEVIEFLKQLPPFPLDISVAAYYLKTMNVPYRRYLEYLNYQDKNFSTIQENLQKEAGAYEKTRYSIITLSLEKLIAADKNFADLLLFISLLDAQKIPRDLLNMYKGGSVVDNFIYYLKKYSLIVDPSLDSTSLISHISIHRSTQDISFAYFTNFFKLNKDSSSIQEMIYGLDDYVDQAIEQENFSRMRLMAPHLERFLTHHNLLTDLSKGLLKSKLGSVYYFINNDKSKQVLADSLNILESKSLEQFSPEDKSRMARSLLHIGAVYTELRLYKQAQEVFEKAINIYGEEGTKNYLQLSWALSHLGNIYRRSGNYEKAKDYLEESARLDKKYGSVKQRTARTLGYLGSVYRGLGFYQKAIDTLRESLAIYNKNYSNDHFRIGWTLIRLGNVYSNLGDFKKAKYFFEKGLLISKKYFPEDHMSMGLTLTYLGNCYRELGEYEKSRDVLEQNIKLHKKYFDENHLRMGWALFHLSATYKVLGKFQDAQKLYDKVLEVYAKHSGEENIETAHLLREMAEIYIEKNQLADAEDLIKRSLKILQEHNHVEVYRTLETLGEIYLKKSAIKNILGNQHLREQAQNVLQKSLVIAEQNFPKSSVHTKRIKLKLKSI